jgi:hypothetical protein
MLQYCVSSAASVERVSFIVAVQRSVANACDKMVALLKQRLPIQF